MYKTAPQRVFIGFASLFKKFKYLWLLKTTSLFCEYSLCDISAFFKARREKSSRSSDKRSRHTVKGRQRWRHGNRARAVAVAACPQRLVDASPGRKRSPTAHEDCSSGRRCTEAGEEQWNGFPPKHLVSRNVQPESKGAIPSLLFRPGSVLAKQSYGKTWGNESTALHLVMIVKHVLSLIGLI